MQYRIFQSSAKFVHSKNQKTDPVHFYINLAETFALILNLKIVFKYLLWLSIDTKKYTICTKPFTHTY